MPKPSSFEAVLNMLTKEELVQILGQAASKDSVLKNTILHKYAKDTNSGLTQQLKSCKQQMKAIVKEYKGREGFIPYRETGRFVNEMLLMLDEIDDSMDPFLALETAWLLLEEGVEAFQYADDSNGEIGMLVQGALERVGAIALSLESRETAVRERFFNRLLQISQSQVFRGWEDFQMDLLRLCAEFADLETPRQRLRETMEQLIASNLKDEYKRYFNDVLQELLFQLIRDYGTPEEGERYVEEHLDIKFFRELAIEQHMRSGDYRRALKLAEEGEIQDQELPGLISKWKAARYEAYKQLSLTQEQERLAKELLLDGDYAYYRELENLHQGDKEELYRSILKELKQADGWRAREVYLQLISKRNDLDEMMMYVKANPHMIEDYAPRLFPEYPEETAEIYSSYISSAAGSSSNRKEYRRVCGILKRYKKIAGKPRQEQLIEQLKAQYAKRPAFLDELDNI
ncbi:hypothetical protein [Paenibacillus lemnae]|uniref:Uncharacterized protein n=1 Tax=Paenibacillus lemnae TaxID=1330551 RepID=A0A848M4C1_PAELE|nr:hypothetical protein [Paenibacillus lemnae]NMO94952.1 hypothetical protein [Paenibacillus lemnae]